MPLQRSHSKKQKRKVSTAQDPGWLSAALNGQLTFPMDQTHLVETYPLDQMQ